MRIMKRVAALILAAAFVAAPAFGAPPELAGLLLAVMSRFPGRRAALRLKFLAEIDEIAPLLHVQALAVPEPETVGGGHAGDTELFRQGLTRLLARLAPGEPPPDLVYPAGNWLRNPHLYILADHPLKAAERALALKQARRAGGRLEQE